MRRLTRVDGATELRAEDGADGLPEVDAAAGLGVREPAGREGRGDGRDGGASSLGETAAGQGYGHRTGRLALFQHLANAELYRNKQTMYYI